MIFISKLVILSFFLVLTGTIEKCESLPRPKRQSNDDDCLKNCPQTNQWVTSEGTTNYPPSGPNMEDCLRRCPVGNLYKPVCGTDGISYDNFDKIRCANQCGTDVRLQSNGVCPDDISTSGTSTSTDTSTSDDQEYQNCVKRCPSLGVFNPICGSDNENYENDSHLECARNCGRNVSKQFSGKCD